STQTGPRRVLLCIKNVIFRRHFNLQACGKRVKKPPPGVAATLAFTRCICINCGCLRLLWLVFLRASQPLAKGCFMRKTPSRFFTPAFFLAFFALFSSPLRAQLVGDTPPQQQLANSAANPSHQESAATPKSTGKKRLAKDFTLKGDSFWIDTGID